MATGHPIDPFPSDICRDDFGHWLSGFTDGDGAFCLGLRRYNDCKAVTPHTSFVLKLRADDAPVLHLIQSFWQCGAVFFHAGVRQPHSDSKPSCSYTIKNPHDLARVVVPHFERFPLRTKKQRDFNVWRKAVWLNREVLSRPLTGRKGLRGGGTVTRWGGRDRERYSGLLDELRSLRAFNAPADQAVRSNDPDFAPWLSGFAAAEGCFHLHSRAVSGQNVPRLAATFQMKLRADDAPILRQIQAFWECDTITDAFHIRTGNPQSLYSVSNITDLAEIVMPHFDNSPLFAKKRLDYDVWREGVGLMRVVTQRSMSYRRGNTAGGAHSKWSLEERTHYLDLINAIKWLRTYRPPITSLPNGLRL